MAQYVNFTRVASEFVSPVQNQQHQDLWWNFCIAKQIFIDQDSWSINIISCFLVFHTKFLNSGLLWNKNAPENISLQSPETWKAYTVYRVYTMGDLSDFIIQYYTVSLPTPGLVNVFDAIKICWLFKFWESLLHSHEF